jgi:hypothetical protein
MEAYPESVLLSKANRRPTKKAHGDATLGRGKSATENKARLCRLHKGLAAILGGWQFH